MAKCAIFHGIYAKSLVAHFKNREERLGCRNVLGAYNSADFKGYNVLVAGPPTFTFYNNVMALRRYAKTVVLYLVVEGRIIMPDFWVDQLERNADYIFVPSRYVAKKVMEWGLRVDDVIPHEIPLDDAGFNPEADGVLYVVGSQKRKYPRWGVSALCRSELRKKLRIIGDQYASRYIPCHNEITIEQKAFSLPQEELRQIYLRHKVYLNLSGSEGFGLTVFEAMKYGEVVVSPFLPSFQGLLEDADMIWIPVEGVGDVDPWPYEVIEIFKYNGEVLIEAATKALEITAEEREKIWRRNLAVLEQTVGRSYNRLIEILHTE